MAREGMTADDMRISGRCSGQVGTRTSELRLPYRALQALAVPSSNCRSALVREIRTPRSVGTGGGRPPPVTWWMWKRSHGRTSEAPPDERGGYRYVRPTTSRLYACRPLPSVLARVG